MWFSEAEEIRLKIHTDFLWNLLIPFLLVYPDSFFMEGGHNKDDSAESLLFIIILWGSSVISLHCMYYSLFSRDEHST